LIELGKSLDGLEYSPSLKNNILLSPEESLCNQKQQNAQTCVVSSLREMEPPKGTWVRCIALRDALGKEKMAAK
jgi:hypothetical protein